MRCASRGVSADVHRRAARARTPRRHRARAHADARANADLHRSVAFVSGDKRSFFFRPEALPLRDIRTQAAQLLRQQKSIYVANAATVSHDYLVGRFRKLGTFQPIEGLHSSTFAARSAIRVAREAQTLYLETEKVEKRTSTPTRRSTRAPSISALRIARDAPRGGLARTRHRTSAHGESRSPRRLFERATSPPSSRSGNHRFFSSAKPAIEDGRDGGVLRARGPRDRRRGIPSASARTRRAGSCSHRAATPAPGARRAARATRRTAGVRSAVASTTCPSPRWRRPPPLGAAAHRLQPQRPAGAARGIVAAERGAARGYRQAEAGGDP